VPLAESLDHVGPLARTVGDAALMYHAMGGETVGAAPPRRVLRLAIPSGPLTDRLTDDVHEVFAESVERLRSAGCTVTTVEIPHASIAPDAYVLISLAEAAEYHAPMLATCAGLYTPPVRARIELGSYVLAEDYLRARRTAQRLQMEVDRALAGHDALILPTLPMTAPKLGETSVMVGSTKEPIRGAMLRQTQLFNMTGHPAITLPNGRGKDGLPTSLQFVGARAGTGRLLAVAQACEPYLASGSGSVGGGTAGFGTGALSSTSSGLGAASGPTGA
jgi:Asp-tRNA(Asn)/Glu-tRNA(Gln) amidotransferase A subunit family amidase